MTDRNEKRTPLYVRIPQSQAEKLDRAAFELKVPKQDLVAGLVAEMKFAPGFTRRRTEVVEVDEGLSVGRASFLPAEPREVLTLADAAELLQVERDVVNAMAEAGELPGRKLGDEWRFSRAALIAWLGGEES
jgi:excisionase family DNA binding protein